MALQCGKSLPTLWRGGMGSSLGGCLFVGHTFALLLRRVPPEMPTEASHALGCTGPGAKAVFVPYPRGMVHLPSMGGRMQCLLWRRQCFPLSGLQSPGRVAPPGRFFLNIGPFRFYNNLAPLGLPPTPAASLPGGGAECCHTGGGVDVVAAVVPLSPPGGPPAAIQWLSLAMNSLGRTGSPF